MDVHGFAGFDAGRGWHGRLDGSRLRDAIEQHLLRVINEICADKIDSAFALWMESAVIWV
ncbi:MAG: hypothetical protein WCE68_18195 [Anaerolineales bacterium]